MKTIVCNSQNLIYCLECGNFRIQYIGQTQNKILVRINQHYSCCWNKVDSSVLRHVNSHRNNGEVSVSVYILQLIQADYKSIEAQALMDRWKDYWMARLYSLVLKGLNIQD